MGPTLLDQPQVHVRLIFGLIEGGQLDSAAGEASSVYCK